jgi:hypothetical protein
MSSLVRTTDTISRVEEDGKRITFLISESMKLKVQSLLKHRISVLPEKKATQQQWTMQVRTSTSYLNLMLLLNLFCNTIEITSNREVTMQRKEKGLTSKQNKWPSGH